MKFAYEKSEAQRIISHEDIMLKTYSKIISTYLEYSWYTIEATKAANAGGEAAQFLAAMRALGIAE